MYPANISRRQLWARSDMHRRTCRQKRLVAAQRSVGAMLSIGSAIIDEMDAEHPNNRPWTVEEVPPGPYFHGTLFRIEEGAEFDLATPSAHFPDHDWGVVNNQEHEPDDRTMFWATTDLPAAREWGARYRLRLGDRFDRIYVWHVELDNPEVDINQHNRWNTQPSDVTCVMATSGRFLRLVETVSLVEHRLMMQGRRP
jgi:hypothetical protein